MKKGKIFRKIALVNTLILLLALFVVGIISHNKAGSALESNLETMSLQTLKQVDKGFNEYLSKMTYSLDILAKNKDIQDLSNPEENFELTAEYVQYSLISFKDTLDGIENIYYAAEQGYAVLDTEVTDESTMPFKQKEWYKEAKNKKNTLIYSDPYVDDLTQKKILTVSRSIEDENGNFIGVVGIDINLGELESYISGINLLDKGYIVIVDSKGKVIIDNDKNDSKVDDLSSLPLWSNAKDTKEGVYEWKSDSGVKFISYLTDEDTQWKLIGYVDQSEISSGLLSIKITIGVAVILCFIIGIFSSLVLAKSITNNIDKINRGVREIAKGNFKDRIEVESNDEIGELSENLNLSLDSISGLIKEIESTTNDVYSSASSIASMSEETTASVSEVANAINGVSNGATDQAIAVENTTKTVNNLAESIESVEKNAKNILELSGKTEKLSSDGLEILRVLVEKAEKTKKNTEESSSSVREMNDSIKDINYISDAIAGITEQTNLLALNASIEAARAGEAGKGFAVVADEIRKLAEESKSSTDSIKEIINEVNKKSDLSSKVMEETVKMLIEQDKSIENTKDIFNQIVDSIEPLVEAIRVIDNLTNNMDADKKKVIDEIESISTISQDVASVSEEVTASAEEVTATMDELTQYADKLNDIAEKLKEELKNFEL
ncbi:MAG: methyl-accepting chemotaxis protein [Clostridium sp.]|nr:methyl-accepting chemotaxis protein [Clostridium sp.]